MPVPLLTHRNGKITLGEKSILCIVAKREKRRFDKFPETKFMMPSRDVHRDEMYCCVQFSLLNNQTARHAITPASHHPRMRARAKYFRSTGRLTYIIHNKQCFVARITYQNRLSALMAENFLWGRRRGCQKWQSPSPPFPQPFQFLHLLMSKTCSSSSSSELTTRVLYGLIVMEI